MTGTFKNPGPLGGFVTVGLSIAIPCLSLIMTRDQKEAGRLSCLVKIASLLTFFLGMVVLPASMSRAAWLALIVALSLFAYREEIQIVFQEETIRNLYPGCLALNFYGGNFCYKERFGLRTFPYMEY